MPNQVTLPKYRTRQERDWGIDRETALKLEEKAREQAELEAQ